MAWADRTVLAAVDIAARLAVPVSLLAVAHGYGDLAVLAAAGVSVLAVLRGLLSGVVFERGLRSVWRQVVDAAGLRSVVALRARPKEQDVAVLLDASRESARVEALVVPKLAANGVGLVLVAAAIAIRIGASMLLLAIGVFLVLGVLTALAQRRLRRAKERAWAGYGSLARDFAALLDGSSELRAHGRERAFVDELLTEVASMARAERQVNTTSSLLGLFPVGLALFAAFAPLRNRLAGWVESLALQSVADASVLGATALVLAVGLARGTEDLARAAPFRRTLAEFLRGSSAGIGAELPALAPPMKAAARSSETVDLREAEVRFDGVTIAFPGAADGTPSNACHRWQPGAGLAVTGDNGSGKTSLALALLGLLRPAQGAILIGGIRADELDWPALAGRVAYQPQQAFHAPGATVGWHLRLLLGDGPTERQLEQALDRVGILSTLQARTQESDGSPLDVRVGELSGGERRRLDLVRALVSDPQLVVLDEPEAGLDPAGREQLRTLVDELAADRRVLLIAQDPSVVPASFERLVCVRGPLARGA